MTIGCWIKVYEVSGWWHGRWQGGVQGRGAFGIRGRGRGQDRGDNNAVNDSHSAVEVPPSPQHDVPPVDRQWTHDGFEELKRREEQCFQRQDQPQGSNGNNPGLGSPREDERDNFHRTAPSARL